MATLSEFHLQAKSKASHLRAKVEQKRSQLIDTDVSSYAQANGMIPVKFQPNGFVCCRTLRGHTGKVYSLDWAQGKERVASVSQDGHLIVWNALTGQKTHSIRLTCSWIMTCAFSPSGKAIVCGGLDCVSSIYTLNSVKGSVTSEPKILRGHKSYISCCKFVPHSDREIITSSGDSTCALWEIESGRKVIDFRGNSPLGHRSDVLSLSVSTANPKLFVSGSCDQTARLWDMRINKSVQTFRGHEEDVNTVQFLSDGITFGTGSDDSTCRIFDTRTGHHLQQYRDQSLSAQKAKAISIAFSYSGRLLFAAYSNGDCYIWDSITAEVVSKMRNLPQYHTQIVSCLGLASDGSALCTGSWDQTLKIWTSKGTIPKAYA